MRSVENPFRPGSGRRVAAGSALELLVTVLGADGKVEDFHVGYDAKLAETLPAKLNRLLAGESLAKEELDKYEAALKAYQQQENDARVADAGQTTAQ